ncbi:VOC family protein [Nocardioides montaniterrae]
MGVRLEGLLVADEPEVWASAGFAVEDGALVVGSLVLRFGGDGTGIVGWALSGLPDGIVDVDGVAVLGLDAASTSAAGHSPNGVTGVDHVVLMTPNLTRTLDALAVVGLEARRTRDAEMLGTPMRQVFYRLGPTVLEVVGEPDGRGDGPASLWGITFTVRDVDATAAYLGEGLGRVKDAVQPGRRIATLRGRSFGISVAVAFLSERS